MKNIWLTILVCGLICGCSSLGGNTIRVAKNPDAGFFVLPAEERHPDTSGILTVLEIDLPPYTKGIYSAQDSYYDYWQVNGNRVLPWVFTPETLADLFIHPAYGIDDEQNPDFKNTGMKNRTRYVYRHGCFLQLQLTDGRYLSLLPLASTEATSWFYVTNEGKLCLEIGNYGTAPTKGEIPALAWATGDNLNQSGYRLFRMIADQEPYRHTLRLRHEKNYPEVFEYLGWCTWEEYKKQISERILLSAIADLKKVPLPIRYVIIDDGHLTTPHGSNNQLSSFSPNQNFPNGFGPLLDQREPDGLRWIGVWQNMNGYWGGFASNNDFGDRINECLRPVNGKDYLVPKNDTLSIRTVYEAFLGHSAQDGFDFLKVDWQAANIHLLRGTEQAAGQAFHTARIVDEIAHTYFKDEMINCMAMNNIILLNTQNVNITRTSIDYKRGNLFMAREHLLQSYHNALYLGPIVWGDHDMFHSSDTTCGQIMTLSKAVSGGPVYLSDAPHEIVTEMARPLCFNNGRLLRPLAPATVMQRSAFTSPLIDAEPYYVSAPLSNQSAAVIAYNLCVEPANVEGSVSADDYAMTGTLMQPYKGCWKIPAEGVYIYDYFAERGYAPKEKCRFAIEGFGHKYFLMLPIIEGCAMIGRTDKYLAPATVSNLHHTPTTLSFDMEESGPVVFWLQEGHPEAEGIRFTNLSNGLWRAEIPSGQNNYTLTILKKKPGHE